MGRNLSGVGVYCRRLLWGLAESHPEDRLFFCYRSHRFVRGLRDRVPGNVRRRLLAPLVAPTGAGLFHALNQRVPPARFRHLVVTFHDLFVMTGEYSSPDFRARFAEQARIAASQADLFICVSAFTGRQLTSLLGVDKSRVRIVPHGVEMPALEYRTALRREPIVLHVGAIQKRKNIVRLVRAFEHLPPPWRLVLAGSPGYDAGEALRAVEESPARERIEIRGYVEDAALRHLYATASILAFPSLDEGFGIPVLEAMAWGIPVVTSNGSSLPEIAGEAALLVDPVRTDDIANALLRLSTDDDLRHRLIQCGLQQAECYTWKAAVERTRAVYLELVS